MHFASRTSLLGVPFGNLIADLLGLWKEARSSSALEAFF